MEPERLCTIIADAKDGSAEAYRTLLKAYGPRLYGYFVRAAGNHHDAEDLLGELTLRLVRQLKNYDDRGRFEPWLFRIAANMVRDRIRRMRVRPGMTSLATEDGENGSLADAIPAEIADPPTKLADRDDVTALEDALAKLDEVTRQIILLRHFGQMSFREIADLLDCPIGTVLARSHRGLNALRKHMGADHDTE